MNLIAHVKALNELDLTDLDLDNIGNWPAALKVILLVILYALILSAGFYLHLEAIEQTLFVKEQQETKLRQEFEQKAFEAANLETYKAQLVEMELRFEELVAQLPSETEVPSLLEDITGKGELNGLRLKRIDLLAEQAETFFVELPIAIEAAGSYHDLAAFISGMASLPRIVTLHDFKVTVDAKGEGLSVEAVTEKAEEAVPA